MNRHVNRILITGSLCSFLSLLSLGQRVMGKPVQKDSISKGRTNVYVNNVSGSNNKIINGNQVNRNTKVIKNITNRFVDSSSTYLIVDSTSLETLDRIYGKKFFPPSLSIQEAVIDRVRKVRLKYPDLPSPSIHVEYGDENRVKVFRELANIFTSNNLAFYKPYVGNSGDSRSLYPIKIVVDDSMNLEYVTEFIDAISPYVRGIFSPTQVLRLPFPSPFRRFDIIVLGIPFFSKDGSVVFQ